jgi:hypothetical protein
VGAKVNGNIVDLAGNYTYKFTLGLRFLEVKASEDAPARKRLVVLHKPGVEASVRQIPLVVRFTKIAPLVAKHLGLDNEEAIYV